MTHCDFLREITFPGLLLEHPLAQPQAVFSFPRRILDRAGVRLVMASLQSELGLGGGNFNIPGVNFMISRRTLIPTFEVYWTF